MCHIIRLKIHIFFTLHFESFKFPVPVLSYIQRHHKTICCTCTNTYIHTHTHHLTNTSDLHDKFLPPGLKTAAAKGWTDWSSDEATQRAVGSKSCTRLLLSNVYYTKKWLFLIFNFYEAMKVKWCFQTEQVKGESWLSSEQIVRISEYWPLCRHDDCLQWTDTLF